MVHLEFFYDEVEVLQEGILDESVDFGVQFGVQRLLNFFRLDVLVAKLEFLNPDEQLIHLLGHQLIKVKVTLGNTCDRTNEDGIENNAHELEHDREPVLHRRTVPKVTITDS